MQKIILYFGSFNPVHIGHMALANFVIESMPEYYQLWFVLSPQNPHKKDNQLIPTNDRIEMMKLAINDYSKFKLSTVELELPTPSYTYSTLEHLKEQFPDKQFDILMGADNYNNIDSWRNSEKILNCHKIIVYPRPGYNINEIAKYNATIIEAPEFNISASIIRKGIKEKKDLRFLLPNGVYEYTIKNKLIK